MRSRRAARVVLGLVVGGLLLLIAVPANAGAAGTIRYPFIAGTLSIEVRARVDSLAGAGSRARVPAHTYLYSTRGRTNLLL